MVELDLLRVDQHEPHLVRTRAQQHRGEHRVDRPRLPRAGGSRDEDVGHLREVRADRLARDVLAEPDGERRPVLRRLLEDVPESHDPPVRVRDLHAHGLLAGDRREDAHVRGCECVGEVILELSDLPDLDPRCETQLIARDVRARNGADQLRLDPEVPERLDQRGRGALLPGGVRPRLLVRRAGEQARGVGELPDEVRIVGDRAAQAPLRRELCGIGVRDAGDLLLLLVLLI